jgi:flagellum-specific ATP synthase
MDDVPGEVTNAVGVWLADNLPAIRPYQRSGVVLRSEGEIIVTSDLGHPIGSRCVVETSVGSMGAEIVGFNVDHTFLMADRSLKGLCSGDRVIPYPGSVMVQVGDVLLGRVINAYGDPIDGLSPIQSAEVWPIDGRSINPMRRRRMTKPLDVGVRAINAISTIGVGMRTGLFAGSGVGKSTLLGMIARHSTVDCVVLAMIGERGREVREFIDDHLGEAIARSVVVVSAADSPPLARVLGAQRAASIAEFFRSQGKNVLFLVDSLTRLAMAEREIRLSVGEPPAIKGYPPSVFTKIASYVERGGMGSEGQGSITGIYTILVEGDDHVGDPISDTARSALDGHIVLSRKMSEAGIYPPIDLAMSLSRPMPSIVDGEHLAAATRFRFLWSRLIEKRELVDIGAYAPGRDPVLDDALGRAPNMENFLRQDSSANISIQEAIGLLYRILT